MLGLRGCRLGITFPEITEMQARPSSRPASRSSWKAANPHQSRIMIPLIGSIEEMRNRPPSFAAWLARFFAEKKASRLQVGTMIEIRVPFDRRSNRRGAEFFSFGTNDLTQTTYGISRDESTTSCRVISSSAIFKQDPFATLDRSAWAKLVKMAVALGTQHAAESQGRHLR